MPKKKFYVLDTSALMENSESIYSFGINDVYIPMQVLEELDKNKTKTKQSSYQARMAIRNIEQILQNKKNKDEYPRIRKGQGVLKFLELSRDENKFPKEYDLESPDNRILKCCFDLNKSSENKVIFISNDINLRIKAERLGLVAESLSKLEKTGYQIYKGYSELLVSDYDIDDFYSRKILEIEEKFPPNQCILLKSEINERKTALGLYRAGEISLLEKYNKKTLQNKKNDFSVSGNGHIQWAYPKNKEQQFAFNLLMDERISVVTILGTSGTGKTILAVSSGIYQTIELERYKRIIITRSVCPISEGQELGFLPGSLEDKMAPWLNPIKDNIEYMFGDKYAAEDAMESGLFEVEALSYIRGRSIRDAFIIIDEAQNLTKHEIKTIVTRVGHGSKIVFTGDIEQIDNKKMNEATNGLTYLVEKFKDQDLSGHIKMEKCERSPLAAMAANVL